MKKNLKFLLIPIILTGFCLLLTQPSLALNISENVNSFGQKIYGGTYMPPQQVASLIIKSILTLLGIIFVGLILYGGFIYMTSQGEADKTKKAKSTIMYAVIGLIIVIAAYSIASFVLNSITESVGGGGGGGTPPGTVTGGS
ncbi:MAG: hypothetical protein PHC97_00635 [Patescibacteria group bacterium]|nr:hypothetical protein [Patescibacteria group bacterium]